tara:strand:- start:4291 stop:4578 length:288 start_codon:yes stop_codon:yes gene_type:complete
MGEIHLLIFSAKWCGPCRMMKSLVWNNDAVKEKLGKFDSVQFLDIDDPNNRAIAIKYKVAAVPMIYVVDEKGKPIKLASTMDARQTVNFLNVVNE